MKRHWRLAAVLAFAVVAAAFTTIRPADPGAEIDYPTGYRHWAHVKTAVVGPDSPFFAIYGGIHSIYANEQAMQGYITGQYPDGAVIVVDVREGPMTAMGVDAGARRRLDIMVKDQTAYAATDGWGYATFLGDNRVDRFYPQASAATRCHACHTRRADQGYVFSRFQE